MRSPLRPAFLICTYRIVYTSGPFTSESGRFWCQSEAEAEQRMQLRARQAHGDGDLSYTTRQAGWWERVRWPF